MTQGHSFQGSTTQSDIIFLRSNLTTGKTYLAVMTGGLYDRSFQRCMRIENIYDNNVSRLERVSISYSCGQKSLDDTKHLRGTSEMVRIVLSK